ncbi:MAG: rhomboid family intramembrane serine protease [Saprospiraceae bacterium]|nr:rhomboid family intramembrane serine protease [Saprospiraceae bacterium]
MSTEERAKWLQVIKIPMILVGILFAVHLLQIVTGWPIYYWGIYPRKVIGLRGILFAPFIHGDWAHLLWNSFPLIALSIIFFYFYPRVAKPSLLMIYFLTGIGVWLFGNSNFHIGASGVIYGMLSFVMFTGIFRRNVKSIILGLIILFFYQGFFSGLIPKEGVSWESHLFGALTGVFAAYFYKDLIEEDEIPRTPSWELEPSQESRFYLPRDTFEKTKRQRIEERRREDPDGWTQDTT